MSKIFLAMLVALLESVVSDCGFTPSSPPVALKTKYYPDGGWVVMRKQNGLMEGRIIFYYPTGSVKAIHYFHHDTFEGVQYTFYPDRRPET